MAQIKIKSETIVKACDVAISYASAATTQTRFRKIKELAEFSIKYPETEPISTTYVSVKPSMIWLDHNEYYLLKDFLTGVIFS